MFSCGTSELRISAMEYNLFRLWGELLNEIILNLFLLYLFYILINIQKHQFCGPCMDSWLIYFWFNQIEDISRALKLGGTKPKQESKSHKLWTPHHKIIRLKLDHSTSRTIFLQCVLNLVTNKLNLFFVSQFDTVKKNKRIYLS